MFFGCMASIFDSCVAFSLLRFFLLHPAEKFFVKQLSRTLGISASSVCVCCKKLSKKNLLLQEKSGNALFYSLNRENSVVRQLGKAVIAEEFVECGALKEFLKEDPGIFSIAVYGSFAKTDFDKKSDIDILVISNTKSQFNNAASLLEKRFGREAALTVLSADEWAKLSEKKEPFFFNVLSDHILLHGSRLAIG